ncbi:MAG: DHA2 family efflux MFS transporter permease subunit [Clostridia bacterium]|nr:DHA2 family efflux MFS transporter permease subunit [Clostridia bacterium]
MAVLDGTIVNVAVPKLMAVFGVGSERIQWVLTAYLLTSGAVVPVTGELTDRLGGKRAYLAALAVFTVGSALCAVAWNANVLIAARVLQAIGGGAIMPVSMAMVYQIVPRERIGTALGIWGITISLAPAIGPTLGGYLIDRFSWHTIFLINLPIGVVGVLLALLLLPESPQKAPAGFDKPGFLLSVAGCFALLLALSKGEDWGWGSCPVVMLLVGALFGLAIFGLWEAGHPEPVLDVRLLRNPVFLASLVTSCTTSIAMYAGVFYLVIFTQALQGYTPTRAGLLLLPQALVAGALMPVGGRLFDRIGALPLALPGTLLLAYTSYLLHGITLDTSFGSLALLLSLRAAGLGLCMMPLSAAGLNTVPPPLVSRATALNTLARNISASLGIAYLTHVMQKAEAFHAAWLASRLALDAPLVPWVAAQMRVLLSHLGVGDAAAGSAVLAYLVQREAMARAIADTFLAAAAIALFGLPFVFLLGKGYVERTRLEELRRWGGKEPA